MRDPASLQRRAGIDGDPDRDQHFLADTRVRDRILEYAATIDVPMGHVLEIGPGTGVLTSSLLDAAERVTAIERDEALCEFLRTEFASAIDAGRFTLIDGDATDVALPDCEACIANLPYGVSSPVLFRLLPRRFPLVVMVQREFGERMAAEPSTDAYGRLSVSAQHFGAVSVREIVPPGAFTPPPAVESAIVTIEPRDPDYDLADEACFLALLRGVFTQRRKTLRNAIRNTTHISGITDPAAVLDQLPEDLLSRRPGTLKPAEFATVSNVATPYREVPA